MTLRCLFALAALASVAHAQSDSTDPRARLTPGLYDAGVAAKGIDLVGHIQKDSMFHPNNPGGLTYANSDLAFSNHYVYQGNFSGFQIFDVADPTKPKLVDADLCLTEQGDVSVWGHLLFVSAENVGSRLDCATTGLTDSVSKERMVGIRIFDISDMKHPRQVADVQTCRGSHTHTLVPDPADKGVIYVYVSGLARVRSSREMPGCVSASNEDPNTSLFRVEIIRVPLAHPEQAKIVNRARIFDNLAAVQSHGLAVADTAGGKGIRIPRRMVALVPASATAADTAQIGHLFEMITLARGDSARMWPYVDSLHAKGVNFTPAKEQLHPTGPSQCHDITVYPAIGLAGGACSGYGLILDIKDPVHPRRLQALSDSNFAFWHSATFSNDGSKVLFTDEWGGGTQPKCRTSDPIDWGADALFARENGQYVHTSFYKMPAAQGETENCVAHNGSLIPVPGRDIMAQAWYQGGASVVDFTDPRHPKEIAYFDRGPIDPNKLVIGGYWGAYWWNGHIFASEIARGLDILDLKPTADLTQNEIDAAKLVRFATLNPQDQPKFVWPDAFPVARAYLDQIKRDNGLSEAQISAIGSALDKAEQAKGAARAADLTKLATQLDHDAGSASDAKRVRWLSKVVKGIAAKG